MNDEQINGLRLPPKLVSAMAEGVWTGAGGRWNAVFPVDEVVHPKLYSLSLMRDVNQKWKSEVHPAFVGVADGRASPGKLVPGQSLLIGELQGDAMIALDYQSEANTPSVAYLNLEGRWAVVAQSFDEFWHRLTEGT